MIELSADMAHDATRNHLDSMRSSLETITADAITYSVALPARVNVAALTVIPTRLG
ncbi:hypothetical protein SAMN05216188_12146 [Lentzea xinjiangensis]|uniref:Uncharacterized protein n=1 Tax=Lentzea xinjiangensis TaxID=402600 RepID=A0A1H9UEI2_9PSEU|nr:hypothetical protein SAMN05216188_12146 [Lentzea xinjiangensis]